MNWFHDVREGFMAGWRASRRTRWVAPFGVMLGGAVALHVLVRTGGG